MILPRPWRFAGVAVVFVLYLELIDRQLRCSGGERGLFTLGGDRGDTASGSQVPSPVDECTDSKIWLPGHITDSIFCGSQFLRRCHCSLALSSPPYPAFERGGYRWSKPRSREQITIQRLSYGPLICQDSIDMHNAVFHFVVSFRHTLTRDGQVNRKINGQSVSRTSFELSILLNKTWQNLLTFSIHL